jgi:hypothetical protein
VQFARQGSALTRRTPSPARCGTQEARENEDIHRREMMVSLRAQQERALQQVNAYAANFGAGARELLADPRMMSVVVGGLTALAVGVFGAREVRKMRLGPC